MFRLVYFMNNTYYKKYFDDFNDLYCFVNLGLILCKTFSVVKIYDVKNCEVFYES